VKVYEVYKVYANGQSSWVAMFRFRFDANDFVTLLKFNNPGDMFSIMEVDL